MLVVSYSFDLHVCCFATSHPINTLSHTLSTITLNAVARAILCSTLSVFVRRPIVARALRALCRRVWLRKPPSFRFMRACAPPTMLRRLWFAPACHLLMRPRLISASSCASPRCRQLARRRMIQPLSPVLAPLSLCAGLYHLKTRTWPH